MSDEQPKKRPLSEIGHLFLSDVRDLHTGGLPPPRRTPPGGRAPPPLRDTVDLTPGDHARAFGPGNLPPAVGGADAELSADDLGLDDLDDLDDLEGVENLAAAPGDAADRHDGPARPITAVIAAHLGARQFDRARAYARHLAAAAGERVGLIELDSGEFRLACYEPAADAAGTEAPAYGGATAASPREIVEAIEELNWDVGRWLLLPANPRTPEARAVLRAVGHWALLTTCDHDGVVCSYRMLKGLADGLAEAAGGDSAAERPALSLVAMDVGGEADAKPVYEKLTSVCQQFLGWPPRTEPAVPSITEHAAVAEHVVLACRSGRDKSQAAMAPQWPVVAEFVARCATAPRAADDPADAAFEDAGFEEAVSEAGPAVESLESHAAIGNPMPITDSFPTAIPFSPVNPPAAPRAEPTVASAARPAMPATAATDAEVLDLAGGDASAESILGAVLRHAGHALAEFPLRPPMCPDARLAVGRDRRVVLLAVARHGLGDLRAVGQAYRWLMENRVLIGMAVPQFALDPNQLPHLRLLVDQADLTADVLRPLLQSQHVTVEAYRRLRWGGRTGLLLEAA